MAYLRISPDCLLDRTTQEAVLYDIENQRMFLLDGNASQFLADCEDNMPIELAALEPQTRDFVRWLTAERLAFFENAPAFVDPLLNHSPLKMFGLAAKKPVYGQIDFVITRDCGRSCSFCPADEPTYSEQGCLTCLRRPASTAPLPQPYEAWTEQACSLGFKRIHVRGGDPFHDVATLLKLLAVVERHPDVLMLITTPFPGTSVEDILRLGAHRQVHLNVVLVDPPSDPCGETTRQLLPAVQAARIAFSITALLSAPSVGAEEELLRWSLKTLGRKPRIAKLHTPGEATVPTSGTAPKKRLSRWQSRDEFWARVDQSSCLNGRLQISEDGSVRPCVSIHGDCGSIGHQGLTGFLRLPELYTWWERNKNECAPCLRCGARYACGECLSTLLPEHDANPSCGYDPASHRLVDGSWSHDGFVHKIRLTGKDSDPICVIA